MAFQDEIMDDLVLAKVSLQACRFCRLGLRDAKVQNSSLTQCHFQDCYLRKAHFVNARLTGSTFRRCNLEKATFRGCDLRFCTFEATRLHRDEVIGCLPVEPNLRRDLAQNLRKNFETLGDKESADVFLGIEIQAREQEFLATFHRKTEYYRSHYSPVDQAKAGLKYIGSKVNGIVWGYGHRVRRLIASYIALTLVFALITCFAGLRYSVATDQPTRTLSFWESLYQAFAETLGVGATPLSPATSAGLVLQVLEGFLGTLFLALLAAGAYRRIAR